MPSIRARLVELALPLLGIKRFFSEPEKMDRRIARLRDKPSPRPRDRWHRRFHIEQSEERGFPVVTIRPRSGAKPGAPHLLYLHGGGYVMDIAAVHWDTVMHLCKRLGASASVPIYPLAPETKAEMTLADMRALYDEIAARNGAENVTVMGDSAGGGMSLALAQMIKEDGGEMPGRLVLFSPWLDATGSGVSAGQEDIEAKDRMLSINGLAACGVRYAGELALADPRVSPLFGELEGLPPMAIFAGTHDILLVDSRRLVEKLSQPGMPEHIYHEYKGMFHVWMLLPVPEGRRALEQAARFIAGKGTEA